MNQIVTAGELYPWCKVQYRQLKVIRPEDSFQVSKRYFGNG